MVTKTKQFQIRSLQNPTKFITISVNLPNGDFLFRNDGVPSSTKLVADGTHVELSDDFVVELVIRPRTSRGIKRRIDEITTAEAGGAAEDAAQSTVNENPPLLGDGTIPSQPFDLDSEGNLVSIDELFERGKYNSHNRDPTTLQLCATTTASPHQNLTKRGKERKYAPKPIITSKSTYAKWMNKPWTHTMPRTNITRSGPHRKYHGIQPQQTPDGWILMCTLCKGGTVLPEKFGQHLCTERHWRLHERLVEENEVAEGVNRELMGSGEFKSEEVGEEEIMESV
jgi:hypothetical protein